MKTIKKIHKSTYTPIADLVTYNPLPSGTMKQDAIDPFIFLNHHGPQVYAKNNNGLPFGPHPHRGMETVTFIIDGDIMHEDSGENKSVINAGGVQWMTAGSGLIHAEVSSEKFKKEGGPLEILQLWLNLPKKDKMAKPYYLGLQEDEIPTKELDGGKVKVQLISGNFFDAKPAFEPLNQISIGTFHTKAGANFKLEIPEENSVFFYIVRGSFKVNSEKVIFRDLVEFQKDGKEIEIAAEEDGVIIIGHAKPFNEAIIAYGPFVMNSEEEIHQAYDDYRSGKFGTWK